MLLETYNQIKGNQMHFEITFRNTEELDTHHSYGLVFIPSAVWVKGKHQLINLNTKGPAYELGGVKRLLEKEGLDHVSSNGAEAVVVINHIGHGSSDDLETLKDDLRANGFRVTVYGNK